MIFSKSARESHTLPPAKHLRQNSTRLAFNCRLRSAFDVISSDPLLSDVSLPLAAWDFARVSCSSVHSANTVGERSNFLSLAFHLFSVDARAPIFSIRVLHFLMDRVAVAQLICSGTSTEASSLSIFSAYVTTLTLFDCATTLPIVTKSLCLLRSSPTAPFCPSSQQMNCRATLSMCLLTALAQFVLQHLHAACIGQRAAARPA